MSGVNYTRWTEENQHYLLVSLAEIKAELKQHIEESNSTVAEVANELIRSESAAINMLCYKLKLSSFERKILLLCAGVELDSEINQLISAFTSNVNSVLPTFGIALQVFKEAHWSALVPASPLRYWRLIELSSAELVTSSPLKIDEQILHYIVGIQYINERLSDSIELVVKESELVPSQAAIAHIIVQACSTDAVIPPVIQLFGNDSSDKKAIAERAASELGLQLYCIHPEVIPNSKEQTEFIRLWNRESVLNGYALFIEEIEPDADRNVQETVIQFIEKIQGLTLISTTRPSFKLKKKQVILEVSKPTAKEQLELWRQHLQAEMLCSDQDLISLTSQFNMSAKGILLAAEALSKNGSLNHSEADINRLWKVCCNQNRPLLNELAERIPLRATWDDLVLPEPQKESLKDIAIQVQYRKTVYEDWGFAAKSSRGLGISALFYGESGTGKTMASEVLANELQLDLYRIDLSQVVNKYIGETEKNLKRIFDAAEDGGAILLFDEADSLFGRRSEVKDSHDRYGNIEVSYLLQRMETYRGLAILTTNMKNVLDQAFLRRLRFVVQFPFPDLAQRVEIWKHMFSEKTPTGDLDMQKLARLNIAGGNIKNIAMNAAFIAAYDHQPVQMSHVSRAARSEYAKLEKMMSSTELGSW